MDDESGTTLTLDQFAIFNAKWPLHQRLEFVPNRFVQCQKRSLLYIAVAIISFSSLVDFPQTVWVVLLVDLLAKKVQLIYTHPKEKKNRIVT